MCRELGISDKTAGRWVKENHVRLSCSHTGNCHDNAVAESFFATLKNEMYYRRSFRTRKEAKMSVIWFIETYYNRKRPHSTIGYKATGRQSINAISKAATRLLTPADKTDTTQIQPTSRLKETRDIRGPFARMEQLNPDSAISTPMTRDSPMDSWGRDDETHEMPV